MSIDGEGRKQLVKANSSPLYAHPGFVMFWRAGQLHAQSIDLDRLKMAGEPMVVAQDVAYDANEMMLASVSASGRLVYTTGGTGAKSSLVWIDRAGRRLGTIAGPASMPCGLALSPDGTRLAVGMMMSAASGCDLWVNDLERGTAMKLSFDEGDEFSPAWSADGRFVLAASDRAIQIVRREASGQGKPEVVYQSPLGVRPLSLSRDGTWMLMTLADAKTASDIVRYDFASKAVTPIVQSPFSDYAGALSPDERRVAYVSDRSGTDEVYVESTTGEGGLWQVSSGGGMTPHWRRDGSELFYVTQPDRLMVVDVLPGDTFRTGRPREVLRAPFVGAYGAYDVTPDGQKFIVNLSEQLQISRLITIVSDWRAAAKK